MQFITSSSYVLCVDYNVNTYYNMLVIEKYTLISMSSFELLSFFFLTSIFRSVF